MRTRRKRADGVDPLPTAANARTTVGLDYQKPVTVPNFLTEEGDVGEFYDLEADPNETCNLV